MASKEVNNKRSKSIEWCMARYPNLNETIQNGVSKEMIYEVIAQFNVSRATALEYLHVAGHKLKLEKSINTEHDKAFNEALMTLHANQEAL